MMKQFDLVIVGLGNVGLATALSAAKLGLRIAVIDQQDIQQFQIKEAFNGLDIALSQTLWRWLDLLGVNNELKMVPAPIVGAQVTDTFIQKTLTFSPVPGAQQLGAFIPAHYLRQALFKVLNQQSEVSWFLANQIEQINEQGNSIELKLADQQWISAQLLIAADGRQSPTRTKLGLATTIHQYPWHMLCCRIEHQKANSARTIQRFTETGSIATLPLADHLTSLALAMPALSAQHWLSLSENECNDWLSQRLSEELGELKLISQRFCVPLTSHFTPKIYTSRAVLIGDAAIGMLPLTAHGLNLGLLGARGLIEVLRDTRNNQQDLAKPALLARYARKTQVTAWPIYQATNFLLRCLTKRDTFSKPCHHLLFKLGQPLTTIIGQWCDQDEMGQNAWLNTLSQVPRNYFTKEMFSKKFGY